MLPDKNIYLLEDDPDISELVKYILQKDGYHVLTFDRVTDFNEQVHKSLPDLFILDVSLPDGNGLEVTKGILANRKQPVPPVLVMSADYYNHEKALVSGANCFIRKPFIVKDFLIRVQSLLAA